MNWLTNFIRPKIRSFALQKEMPDNLWQKCPACDGMLFNRDLTEHLNVCYHCGHHMRIGVAERLKQLFDGGEYRKIPLPKTAQDPLKFKDRKRYADRLKDYKGRTEGEDALIAARGTVGGLPAVIAAFDFAFMGGSMGAAVGEGLVAAAQVAVREGAALIAIPASGGARMQEGMLSLVQMPRTVIAADMVKEAGLPYIVLLTDPTTGGVSASFAMVGDIHIAEPGCTIGFAGKRVIQDTIREALPPGFQTAEYLLAHGMIDMVVPRRDLRATLGRILGLLMRKTGGAARALPPSPGNTGGGRPSPGGGGGRGAFGAMARVGKAVKIAGKPANANADKKAARKTASEKARRT